MRHPLLSEIELNAHGRETLNWLQTLTGAPPVFWSDANCGAAFRCYLLLTHKPAHVRDLIKTLSEQDEFYDRYYWFSTAIELWQRKRGHDAGMQQQAFQLLEGAGFPIDWLLIHELDARVRSEIDNSPA